LVTVGLHRVMVMVCVCDTVEVVVPSKVDWAATAETPAARTATRLLACILTRVVWMVFERKSRIDDAAVSERPPGFLECGEVASGRPWIPSCLERRGAFASRFVKEWTGPNGTGVV